VETEEARQLQEGFSLRGYQKIIPFSLGSSLLKAHRLDFELSLNIGAKSQEAQTGQFRGFSRLFSKNSRKGATGLVTC
jgi:hypothetical protein